MNYLTFENLAFVRHPNHYFEDKTVQAIILFNNGYGVSVVSAPANSSGLYGNIDENTFEVAAIKGTPLHWEVVYPENTSFKTDILGWRTPEEVTELMKELQDLKRKEQYEN